MSKGPRDVNKLAGMAFGEALERFSKTDPNEVKLSGPPMRDSVIDRLIASFEDAAEIDDEGVEFWFARDLAKLLEYNDYRNFLNIVEKAKIACHNSGQPVNYHFVDTTEKVDIGSGAVRPIDNIKLTRYAAYLVAQNGDSRKRPVSFAQTYFAIQTRRQEIQDDDIDQYVPLSEDEKRVLLRQEIKDHNTKLASAAAGAGVAEPIDFAIFTNFGYQGLYGGLDRRGIQRRKGLKSKQNILDHMGSTELAANLFRATQTEEKLRRDRIKGKDAANSTHFEVGRRVRQTIKDLGGKMPEALPVAEDVAKVARRLKKAIKEIKNDD
jgi:DNA-damage-inducible protein D